MKGKSLYLLAFILLGLAVLVGAYGLSRGTEPASEAAAPAEAESHEVWVFKDPVAAGAVLDSGMLVPRRRAGPAPLVQVDPRQLSGRILKEDVAAGSELNEGLLAYPQPLLDALSPGFRALALRVDEVSAVGGYLHTGDRVDVLFYLKANRESGQDSTARRLLANVVVLAHGSELIGQETDEAARQERAKSVVLAVPEQDTAALLLAESSGSLRLAVVGRQEEVELRPSAMPVRLKELAAMQQAPAPTPQPRPRLVRQAGGARVEVFYGEQKAVVTTAR
ncbi:Flp pilus assembly protein CpaB [Zobellella endophytica]|uniref:Flp pilus assembly protein CpaB n=1 Tax=Zobellella endophytica TaxID=2116700 RepID=A0A2P7RD26_9GAMM|nr:Flp pilus assembly protein CpaB [Zobellella endophytica]PSJ48138.1 Flp pilus assembly protein CpaB [Zobellella endophytica]